MPFGQVAVKVCLPRSTLSLLFINLVDQQHTWALAQWTNENVNLLAPGKKIYLSRTTGLHTSLNIACVRNTCNNTTSLRGHACVHLYMYLYSHIQFFLSCTRVSVKIHTNDIHVTPELDVVTAGVTNMTNAFPLVTNFSRFSQQKYFCWRLNLKTYELAGTKVFSWKSIPVLSIKILSNLFGIGFGIFQHWFFWYSFTHLTSNNHE